MLTAPRHLQAMAHNSLRPTAPNPTAPTHSQSMLRDGQKDTPCSRLHTWLARVQAALECAERRITENFRVPPHGG